MIQLLAFFGKTFLVQNRRNLFEYLGLGLVEECLALDGNIVQLARLLHLLEDLQWVRDSRYL